MRFGEKNTLLVKLKVTHHTLPQIQVVIDVLQCSPVGYTMISARYIGISANLSPKDHVSVDG